MRKTRKNTSLLGRSEARLPNTPDRKILETFPNRNKSRDFWITLDCPEFLGRVSTNPYDPDSVANPYGNHGSPFSSTSIKNPYSPYGSPFSSQSPNNPYATQAPLLFGD